MNSSAAGSAPVLMSQEPLDTEVTSDNEDVTLMVKRWQGKLYLWVLNTTRNRQKAVLTLPAEQGGLVN